MRIDRLLAITIMLLNRDRISARALAEYFEVSVRTIYRDVDALNLAGIPIISYPGNSGGFGIVESYKIDRQLLTLDNMMTILTTLKGVNITLEDRQLDMAIEKISSLIPVEKDNEIRQHFNKMVIDISPWGYGRRQKDKLKMIYQALNDNKLLKLTYYNTKGEETERAVEPMTLIFKGFGWYLFAYCRNKNDFRLFRLSRMRNLHILSETFSRKDVSYRGYDMKLSKSINWVKLELKFSKEARVRVEDQFEPDQIRCQEDGSLIVNVSFPEDTWVYATILSYGEQVEVLKPEYIREIILEKIKKTAGIYET
jgi:predicted DNA-binding transcriptional regulator YafY